MYIFRFLALPASWDMWSYQDDAGFGMIHVISSQAGALTPKQLYNSGLTLEDSETPAILTILRCNEAPWY